MKLKKDKIGFTSPVCKFAPTDQRKIFVAGIEFYTFPLTNLKKVNIYMFLEVFTKQLLMI